MTAILTGILPEDRLSCHFTIYARPCVTAGLFLFKHGSMKQEYHNYTEADQQVWQTLYSRQAENLRGKACDSYLKCLDALSDVMHADEIPRFEELDRVLLRNTGWSIEVVPGHIPVRDFFGLLACKRFPASTWLRAPEQLDYLEEPDMFHDIFGHIPLLMDTDYAKFMHAFGQQGTMHMHSEHAVSAMRSLYWFTVEFGLVGTAEERRIYGAGILSSYGESKAIFKPDTHLHDFSIPDILATDFRTDVMQNVYFLVPDLDTFLHCLDDVEASLQGSASSAAS